MSSKTRHLLERFAQELPAGATTLVEGTDKSGNRYLELCPRNQSAARIRVLDEDGTEHEMLLGHGTAVEIPITGKALVGLPPEEQFLDVCRATAKGEIVEKICRVFGSDLFVSGTVNVRGQVLRSFSGIPFPCWKTVKYQPY